MKIPKQVSVKLSNIWKAGISTFIGCITGTLTTIATSFAEGGFDKKALSAGVAVAVIMAVTDILKEVKSGIDAPKS